MATLRTTSTGRPSVTLERTLAHPPEKVWRAITAAEELAHWFPAAVTLPAAPAAGGKITFTFPETGDTSEGEIVCYRPPEVFEFTWNSDLIQIVVSAEGSGSKLSFTHTFNRGEPDIALLGAGRHVTGWVACLDALAAALDGRDPQRPTDWHDRMVRWIGEFGLEDGELLDGRVIRFRRDLVWPPAEDVWQRLPQPPDGAAVTESRPPEVLAHQWCHDGKPAGEVRWEITADPLDGVRVELTQTVPDELAGQLPELMALRHEQLNALFAGTFGVQPAPWPADRVAATRQHYAELFS
ncbi:SRPBCC domain-containing protein [Amycolatopsis benzoatilytica]|uniref:SRPBCC domain-containing protein n=1 Tax=Amycolatopsis benzoatilytica TaxID=346045 RepID=UPI0003614E57|nr:SRPBCC domain-containing protein [Amycolatopsis benzoatilytica]